MQIVSSISSIQFRMSTHFNFQKHCAIGLMNRVFANDPEDQGSISGRVITKTQKTVLDAALLNTQHYSKDQVWSEAIQGKE